MTEACEFRTVARTGEGILREKMSKFIATASHAATASEAKAIIADTANRYHDARHVCWAYMIGAERLEFLSSDNGEPSGTAGKPILGQINSAGITDVVVTVVRYFGGIKLGTSGLISAYREAARLAIEDAGSVTDHVRNSIRVTFPYLAMNDVMRAVKNPEVTIVSQEFDNSCTLTCSIRSDMSQQLAARLDSIDGTSVEII